MAALKGQTQGHADFEALYPVIEEVELRHMLQLNINRRPYMASHWCNYI